MLALRRPPFGERARERILYYVVEDGDKANPAVISTRISASVVQVVGLLVVITRHLFPGSGSPSGD